MAKDSYDQQDWRLPVFVDRQRNALLQQRRTYRAAMDVTAPKPSRRDYGACIES